MSKVNILFIKVILCIPYAQSLKQKRQPVKSLKQRLQNRFNASVAEIDALDNWQQAILGVTMIANDKAYLEQQASKIQRFILDETDMELVEYTQEFF
jgi:hypothetical protein